MEERYNARYQDIPIPEELPAVVAGALRRGRRRKIRRLALSGMAALLTLTFLTANIPMLSVRAAEVPVLGQLIHIMRVGSGGTEGSGVHVAVQAAGDGFGLTFDGPVPPFSVVRRTAPDRIVLRLHGVLEPEQAELADQLGRHPAVTEAYPMACTASDELGLVIHLQPGWSCTVGQYDGPEALLLHFAAAETLPGENAYVLSSGPMAFGEELAELTEALLWEGATQLRRPDGQYQVVVGSYPDPERAEAARQGIADHTGIRLHVEQTALSGKQ